VGYLESVTEQLSIDLITVSAYDVGGSRILVPQRVDAERPIPEPLPPKPPPTGSEGWYVEGAEDFAATIDSAKEEHRPMLRRLYKWAMSLDREGLVRLGTYHAKGGDMITLLPRLRADNAGLVTIYNYSGTASLQFWRSVFERRAPENLPRVEQVAPVQVGQGTLLMRSATSYSRRSPMPIWRRPQGRSADSSK
jgi:hypothetical protein